MKNQLLINILLFASLTSAGQSADTWIAFWNKDTTLIGFMDNKRKVKVEPKFMGLTVANRFDHIIGVTEQREDDYLSYYLTKSGKKVGVDSMYIYDNTTDCESEGFIRFKNKKTDMVGMFDKNGSVAIPAEYNALTRVRNGLIVALKNASKSNGDNHKHDGCNHYSWKGGSQYLINTNNEIIIENFDAENHLNLYSFRKEKATSQHPSRKVYEGVGGKFYSFIDYEEEFAAFTDDLLTNLNSKKLNAVCHKNIYIWKNQRWISKTKEELISTNFELIKSRLSKLRNKKSDFQIFVQSINPYVFAEANSEKYINNCGETDESKYPVMNIVINNRTGNKLVQDHFDFLRTDNGYRLISVTIRGAKLK